MSDVHNLGRFVDAQEHQYESAIQQLRNGMKQGHWMWYIFPQIEGLGKSDSSKLYAIKTLEEAKAYYDHPVLGSRLQECTRAVLDINGRTTKQIFGCTDNVKFLSCMTLFDCAIDDGLFRDALNKYFGGEADQRTLNILKCAAEW